MSDAPRKRANAPSQDKAGFDIKKFRTPIIILLIAGAAIGYNVAASQGAFGLGGGDPCPGHWHSTYTVWDGDQQMSFNPGGPAGNAGASPAAGFHIHGDDGILHFHPATTRCIELGDALQKMGVEVTDDSLILAGEARTANATHQVVVYHQAWEGEWEEVRDVDGFMEEQIGNGDRIMIAFMAKDSAISIEDRQAATRDLTGDTYEPPEEGTNPKYFIRITAFSILALVAIAVWYNMASKSW